jgi:hypothetical protein
MLTGDLLQFRRRHGRLLPHRINPADPCWREAAERLAGLFQAHTGQRRGDLEEAIGRFVPTGLDPKRVRGLARLLMERCRFQVAAGADPPAARRALFGAAAEQWRRLADAGTAPWRAALLEHVGQGLGLGAAQLDAALYADLEENQVLAVFDPVPPERLLLRYNVAQVQGLLLRAERMRICAHWPNPRRMRQLLRFLKFFGLLFTVKMVTAPGRTWLELTVDGPLSVLEGAGRYGLNLAQFFPALLLWEGPWRMVADVRLRGRDAPETLEIEPHPELRSHYPDHGQWLPESVRSFVVAFNATPGPWRAEAEESVVMLPGNAFLVPDFRFVRECSGKPVVMEHILYPTAERVSTLLQRAEQVPDARFVFAARRFGGAPISPRLFTYRHNLTPAAVREWLEALPVLEAEGA